MSAAQAKPQSDKCPQLQNFKVLKSLGEGSYGKVFKVQRTTDEQSYALKETQLGQMKHHERQDAVNEIRLLVSINHPNVIRYHEAFLNGTKLCVVMEYAPFGDLRYYINKANRLNAPFPEEAIWRIFLQLCKGLAALHSNHVIHRDIKPANIFLCANDLLKIGDLGISKALTQAQFTRTAIGTPIYMAPEVWAERPYSYSSDMWSVGCVLYEMMTFQPPFNGRSMADLGMRVRSGRYTPVRAGSYSAELIAFAHSLLTLDPRKRPTAQEILSHPVAAKWMRVLPTPPSLRRHSENGNGQNALANVRGPSSSGGLLDTILVPRDLKQLPRVLPPPSYDSDLEPSRNDQAPKPSTPPPVAARPVAPPAVVIPQQHRAMAGRRMSPIPPAYLPGAGVPGRSPSPIPSAASSAPQLPRLPSSGAPSPSSGAALINNRPPLPRLSEPGCGTPSIPVLHVRPRSAIHLDGRGQLPILHQGRPSADGAGGLLGPLPGGGRVPIPPRRVSYS